MPGRPSATNMASNKRKRKQKGGASTVPKLPPQVADEDVEISDEDLEFVRKHKDYAGFFANVDAYSISRQVLGLKPDQDGDDLETYYEKRATRANEAGSKKISVDPVDVLPVKSLTGELHYRSTATGDAVDATSISMEDRRALVRKGTTSHLSEGTDEVAEQSLADQGPDGKDAKKSKVERRKELKQLRRKQREEKKLEKLEGRVTTEVIHEPSGPSLAEEDLEELEDFVSVHERRSGLRTRMAEIGTGLLADPENNLAELKELQDMCLDRDDSVSHLAMLSSMAIFKDLIPGYRIRLPSEKELEMAVSKDVKKLRDYETALLRHYKAYVQILVKAAKSKNRRWTALKCLGALLEAVPHFNYRESLLSALVPRMNSWDDQCCKTSCDAIISLFKKFGKQGGEATVEAVQLIADLVKLRNCNLRPEVMQVFLHLSFDEDLVRSAASRAAGQPTMKPGEKQKKSKREEKKEKKAKKRELAAKLRKEVKADFKEAAVLPEVAEYRKQQTLTLSSVFETYFRVLKTSLELPRERYVPENADKATWKELGPRPLLGPCLEGLAKFAHLINVDFMGDLLEVLRTLASGGKFSSESSDAPITVWEQLQCCIIAFKIVKNNMDALNIDLREFYVRFYNLLLDAMFVREDERSREVLAQALEVMLWEGRHTDMQRAAAFVKRLSTLALHLEFAEAVAALVTVRHLLVRYKRCRNILENDGGGGPGGGISTFHAEGDDPDLSGALSTVLWEMTLLSEHCSPAVADIASTLATMSNSTSMVLPTLTPTEAIKEHSSVVAKVEVHTKPRRKKFRLGYKAPLTDFMTSLEHQYNLKVYDTSSVMEDIKPVQKLFTSHFKVLKAFKRSDKQG